MECKVERVFFPHHLRVVGLTFVDDSFFVLFASHGLLFGPLGFPLMNYIHFLVVLAFASSILGVFSIMFFFFALSKWNVVLMMYDVYCCAQMELLSFINHKLGENIYISVRSADALKYILSCLRSHSKCPILC
jgi:hypothetical protein